jgi:hypothetical protein
MLPMTNPAIAMPFPDAPRLARERPTLPKITASGPRTTPNTRSPTMPQTRLAIASPLLGLGGGCG